MIFTKQTFISDTRGYHNRKGDVKKHGGRKSIDKKRQGSGGTNSNRYCSCNMKLCNCCREFNLPVVSLQGPGCASLQYLKGDRLAISMSFGQRVLTNTTISSKLNKRTQKTIICTENIAVWNLSNLMKSRLRLQNWWSLYSGIFFSCIFLVLEQRRYEQHCFS